MPPTALDAWLTDRRFGIVIDAGSSGSRLQIYSWKDPQTVLFENGDAVSRTLPKVDKGTRIGEEWFFKTEPGLSSYADDPDDVGKHLAPLLHHAREHIPPSLHKKTPLFLLSTAGMRLLPPIKQAAVLRSACNFLKLHSDFRMEEPSETGPCGSSVRIITGEEEGLFGWIAVNYLMDGFTGRSADRTTYGFLDMGGASTQIAFEPIQADLSLAKNLIDVRLRLLGGEEIHHQVFVTTWLGYGTNQARERYVGQAIDEFERNKPPDTDSRDTILDPCLPKNLERTESPVHMDHVASHNYRPRRLRGTGSFEQCLRKTLPLLNKDIPCPDSRCLFNGVHVPPIDFSVSHFIGVSEYWYSSEHVFDLGGPYDFVQYERAASDFCSREWSDILSQHEDSRKEGRLGGDGEVVEDGKVTEIGKWGKAVEISRLEAQCFKAAWIVNVLHEGIGMPRIVDPGGNLTTDGENVAIQAERKGLGRPTFQSVDSVDDIAISWTLGKMVLEASKEVPPRSKLASPLVDPLDDAAAVDAPIKPIRPPFFDLDSLDDRLSLHLPSSLHRSSLGFSPVLFLFYVTVVFVLIFVVARLKYLLPTPVRRLLYPRGKRDRDLDSQTYVMEEGNPFGSQGANPILSSPSFIHRFLQRVRRLLSPVRSHLPLPKVFGHGHDSRSINPSNNSTTGPLGNGFVHVASSNSSQYRYLSRSPSPALHEENPSLNSLTSRSRNASQLNLTSTLVPRPGTLSRKNSSMQINPGSYQDDYA